MAGDKKQTPDDVESLMQMQREYFATGATLPWKARKDALTRLEKALVDRRDEVIGALGKDLGKPEVEAFLAEYYFLLQELRLIRKSLKKWLKTRRVGSPFYFQPCKSAMRRDPFGRVLILAPWNYPVQLSLSPLIAAVAAGNTVVLKPSEMAPATAELITQILGEAFPSEHVAVVTGDAAVASELLDQAFDFIFFTGSTQVGRIVAKKASANLTPNILELGGKCPCIVSADANIPVAARRILAGKFFNGGQTCFAPDFVAVDTAVKADLVSAMREVLDTSPWNDEMAHIINEKHYTRLESLIPDDVLVFGSDDPGRLRMAPRLVPDADWGDVLMEEEIFGPILPIVTFHDYEELDVRLRDYDSPLALYIFSDDNALSGRLMNNHRSGGVCINDTMKQGSNLNIPFGGVGDSGYGRYRGKAGVEAFSYERAVVRRPFWAPEFFELMPPYGDKINLLKRFMR